MCGGENSVARDSLNSRREYQPFARFPLNGAGELPRSCHTNHGRPTSKSQKLADRSLHGAISHWERNKIESQTASQQMIFAAAHTVCCTHTEPRYAKWERFHTVVIHIHGQHQPGTTGSLSVLHVSGGVRVLWMTERFTMYKKR